MTLTLKKMKCLFRRQRPMVALPAEPAAAAPRLLLLPSTQALYGVYHMVLGIGKTE